MKASTNPVIEVVIRDRQAIQFEDSAKAVTSINEKGVFDILPNHANFISIVKDTIIIHKNDNQKQEIKISKGILRVSENKVNIYLGVLSDNSQKA